VAVLAAVGLPVTLAFAAAPAAPFEDSAGERSVLGNSRGNSAVLVAENLAPGDSRSETVTIANDGGSPVSFALSKAGLSETPGRGGGKLSKRLELRVEDVSGEPLPAVYRGTIASMPRQMLGRFAAGESRTYRFTVTFPDGGVPSSPTSGDNAYMGGSVNAD
jgi:hypothetical protein